MSYFHLLTGLRTNQYILCWHMVTKTSLPAEINIRWVRSGVGKGPMKVYILYEQGAARLRWRQIMMTGYRRHISLIHNFTGFSFIWILNSLPCELSFLTPVLLWHGPQKTKRHLRGCGRWTHNCWKEEWKKITTFKQLPDKRPNNEKLNFELNC